jgi:hypothetical protein
VDLTIANPRGGAPSELTRLLAPVVTSPAVAVVIDIDAFERRRLIFERPLLLVLDALAHARVQVVISSSREREPPIARCWCVGGGAGALATVRTRMPAVSVIAISDDPVMFDALVECDRGLSLVGNLQVSHVVAAGELAIRAALWWVVRARGSSVE